MKRLTKFILSVLTGIMLLGMTAFASEYSVTPASAVLYTNGETVVLADAAEGATEANTGTPAQPQSTQSELPTYTTYAEVKAYAISLGYPIGTAVDNGDGTTTNYSILYITPDGCMSFDGEYAALSADDDAARKQACDILGFNFNVHYTNFGNYKNTTIANAGNGYIWKVCREQFWLTAK